VVQISSLDHLVLTVASIDATVRFYTHILGMRALHFGNGRTALAFGDQRINLHQRGAEYLPRALNPTPGSADLCFLTATPLTDVMMHCMAQSVKIEQGPIRRTGAIGPINSIYLRDPDGNLIEISNQIES